MPSGRFRAHAARLSSLTIGMSSGTAFADLASMQPPGRSESLALGLLMVLVVALLFAWLIESGRSDPSNDDAVGGGDPGRPDDAR